MNYHFKNEDNEIPGIRIILTVQGTIFFRKHKVSSDFPLACQGMNVLKNHGCSLMVAVKVMRFWKFQAVTHAFESINVLKWSTPRKITDDFGTFPVTWK